MKSTRRRRHLRPRPTRGQINQRIQHVTCDINLLRLEWIIEAHQPEPDHKKLYFLRDAIVALRDELSDLEEL